MDPTLAAMRRDYSVSGLRKADVASDPILQFQRWFEEAKAAEVHEPNAMTLATVAADGQPSARIVLLKIADRRGLAFFTNQESRKGLDIAANPKGALTFWWGPLERQVRFEGPIEPVEPEEADGYFASRPRESRIGAWASPQSRVIADRAELEAAERAFSERYPGDSVPRPPRWGGYRLLPASVEFWQGRRSRLHDRIRYRRAEGGEDWLIERLAP